MRKWKLLPGFAVKGVMLNGSIYYPYIISCIFSVFTYYIFASILENDLIATLPHSEYAWVMLLLGKILLIPILIPFLYYANSFLVKRRKKETGLYTLLGMERKHLVILLLLETLLVYILSVSGGILFGVLLAKLFFLLLLKLSSLPVEAEFVFSWKALGESFLFFAAVSTFTFLHGAAGIFLAQPVELLSGNRKGEKEPRFLLAGTAAGVLVLMLAYNIVFHAKLDGNIFLDFFKSVFLVIAGTYLLFIFAGVAVLRLLRRKKRFYYRPENFITVSGMYYRMKKSAAGLANICIFSSMVMITLTCTAALYAGLDGIIEFAYPYETILTYDGSNLPRREAEEKLSETAEKYGLSVNRLDTYADFWVICGREESRVVKERPGIKSCQIYLLTLDDYNRLTGKSETLKEEEVLLYSTGGKYGNNYLEFMGTDLNVREVQGPLTPWPCAGRDCFGEAWVLTVKDDQMLQNLVKVWEAGSGEEAMMADQVKSGIQLTGPEDKRAAFQEELKEWQESWTGGMLSVSDGLEGGQMIYAMNGGLLFIGILFGMLFFMCLLLIMYYKQISEGYEDQGSFSIMQKVGMSDADIRSTVRRQMMMVFAFPLLAALIHSAVGMYMVNQLMGALRMFDTALLVKWGILVAFGFTVVYVSSYWITSRAYYRRVVL